MEQIDFSNYNLDGRKVNQLAYLFHKSLGNNQLIEQIIQYFNLDNLVESKNNGIVSNLLQYYIGLSNNTMIEYIVTKVELLDKFQLMKRDYLHLIKYYYADEEKFIWIFNKLFSKTNHNTEAIIQTKDIDFMIENRMTKILSKLTGLFIESSLESHYPIVNPKYIQLKTYCSSANVSSHILESIEHELGIESKTILNNFWMKQTTEFNPIIDGGNVLHSRNGTIGAHSLKDLENLIQMVTINVGNPLLILHKRHIKNIPNLTQILHNKKISYFLTPYNVNDDMFILWFFLKTNSNPKSFIISNDKYRDHIFKFETDKKKSNMDFSWSQFKNIIGQQTLGYDVVNNYIDNKPEYSRCIQQINDKIYVPNINGGFIEIPLN